MDKKRSKMKNHKKLEYREPQCDELTNREKFELVILILVCCFIAAGIVAFIIASVQAVANGE